MYGIQICYEIARRRFWRAISSPTKHRMAALPRLDRVYDWRTYIGGSGRCRRRYSASPVDAWRRKREDNYFYRGRLRRPVRASLRAKSGVAKANDSPDDGTEQLVGIISTPVYSRTVSLPD